MGELRAINGRVARTLLQDEEERLEREACEARDEATAIFEQFVTGQGLTVTAGPHKGEPLGPKGRRRRLNKALRLLARADDLRSERERVLDRLYPNERARERAEPEPPPWAG